MLVCSLSLGFGYVWLLGCTCFAPCIDFSQRANAHWQWVNRALRAQCPYSARLGRRARLLHFRLRAEELCLGTENWWVMWALLSVFKQHHRRKKMTYQNTKHDSFDWISSWDRSSGNNAQGTGQEQCALRKLSRLLGSHSKQSQVG